jgi:hypothetical protein
MEQPTDENNELNYEMEEQFQKTLCYFLPLLIH